MWGFVLASFTIVVVFGWNVKPVDLFGDTGALGTIPIIITYLVTNLALPVYMIRYHRDDFKLAKHALLPAIGTVLMLFPLWGLVQPGQPAPISYFPWIALAVLAFSIVYGVILERSDPDLVQKIGSYVADDEF